MASVINTFVFITATQIAIDLLNYLIKFKNYIYLKVKSSYQKLK